MLRTSSKTFCSPAFLMPASRSLSVMLDRNASRRPSLLERLERGAHVGPGPELEVRLHELRAPGRRQLELQQLGCVHECVFRGLPEVRVTPRQGAQPLVFELAGAPRVGQRAPLSGKERLREPEDGSGIEDREGVERHGSQRPSRRRRVGPRRQEDTRHRTSRASQQRPSIQAHGSLLPRGRVRSRSMEKAPAPPTINATRLAM